MEKIRVGVVGVGYFGQFHAEKYSKMKDVELVGVVDLDPSRAQEIARRCHTKSFQDHTHLFDKVQAVSIASPTPSHTPIAKDFFLQGIDVLLEKPIAGTLEEADELIELAGQKGRILQVGHLERFNGALSAVEGLIEDPLFIESQRLGPFSGRGTEINVVLDLMVHDIDILLNWVHSKVKQVLAVGVSILTSSFDVAHARIEFENGCTASLTASRFSREKIRKTRIFQSNGMLLIDFLSQKASSVRKGEPLEMSVQEIPVTKVDPLEAEIRSFLQSVRDRKEAKVSGRAGKRALEVVLQIVQQIEDRIKNK